MSEERKVFENWFISEGLILTDINPYALVAWDAFQAGAKWQQSQQSAPAGWQLVKVNDAFDTLVYALERADRKDYLADSLIEPWEAFDYEYVAAAPAAQEKPHD